METKRCTGCGQVKPRSEFYVIRKATATAKATVRPLCRDCENAKPRRMTPARLLRSRARGRAVADLVRAHEAEFEALFEARLAEARAEAERLAAVPDAVEHYSGGEPVRLRPGARQRGQTTVDRVDVARCPHCVTHHDRGHRCLVCGTQPVGGEKPPKPWPGAEALAEYRRRGEVAS